MTQQEARSKILNAKGQPLTLADVQDTDEQRKLLEKFSRADDIAIESELKGLSHLARYLVYAIPFRAKTKDGGEITKNVIGLSIHGVRTVARKFHPKMFRIEPISPGEKMFLKEEKTIKKGAAEYKVPYVCAAVKLTSKTTDEEGVGVFEQSEWTWGWRKDGGWYHEDNPHAIQTALSKAQRKAMEDQIDPPKKFEWLFRWYRDKAKVAQLDENSTPLIEDKSAEQTANALTRRLFAIANGAGLDANKNTSHRNAVIRYVEGRIGKKLSEMTEAEKIMSGDLLDELLEKGSEVFRGQVLGVVG